MCYIFQYDEYDYLDYNCPKRSEITELIASKSTKSKGIENMLMNKMGEYFKRIELSDAILVINVCNYVGDSTNTKIEYIKIWVKELFITRI